MARAPGGDDVSKVHRDRDRLHLRTSKIHNWFNGGISQMVLLRIGLCMFLLGSLVMAAIIVALYCGLMMQLL